MGIKKMITLIGVVLTSCAFVQETADKTYSVFEYVNDEGAFSVVIPDNFTLQQTVSDGQFFAYDQDHGGFSIRVYKSNPSLECRTSFNGMINQTKINNNVIWGKVDYRAVSVHSYDSIKPPCIPQKIAYLVSDGSWSGSHAYALCAQNDNGAILICIDQDTDSPQLAEEIFRSFRWVE